MNFLDRIVNTPSFPNDPLKCGVLHWRNIFKENEIYSFEKFKESFYSSNAFHCIPTTKEIRPYIPQSQTLEEELVGKEITLQTYFKFESMFSKELLDFRQKCRETFNVGSNFVFVTSTHKNVSAYGYHTDVFGLFIFQFSGSKSWELPYTKDGTAFLNYELISKNELLKREDLELKKFVLERGDVLYVPPYVPHLVTNLGEGLSFHLDLCLHFPTYYQLAQELLKKILEKNHQNISNDEVDPAKFLINELLKIDSTEIHLSKMVNLGDQKYF